MKPAIAIGLFFITIHFFCNVRNFPPVFFLKSKHVKARICGNVRVHCPRYTLPRPVGSGI